MRTAFRSILCGACLVGALALTGCSPSETTTITPNPEDEQVVESITPLERGKLRRAAEASAQEAIDAWISGDREAFAAHFGELPQELLFTRWDEMAAAGQTIDRVHDFISLDVYEMNSTGTQVLVKYRFYDNSVVTDPADAVVESGDGIQAEFQMTLEPAEESSDTWIVVRMIGNTESIR